jgi:hypothetical protein
MLSEHPLIKSLRRLGAALALVVLVVVGVGVVGGGEAFAAGLSDPSALTVHDGSMTVTTNGAVIENLEIRGRLVIEASNVTVRNTWIYAGGTAWTVHVKSGSARFENVEIGHPSHRGSAGIGGNNITAIGVDIHHVEDGIKLGSSSVYSGVRVHDLASPSSSPHSDAVQVEGGSTNSTVKNSVLSSLGSGSIGNSAVIVKSDFGQPKNITFANNYMNGGNYTIFVRDGGKGMPQNIQFTGNRFGETYRYGYTSIDGGTVWENNTVAETGAVIDIGGGTSGGSTTTTTKAPAPTTTTKAPAPTTTTKAPAPTTTTTTAPPTTTTTTKAPATTTTSVAPVISTTSLATTSTSTTAPDDDVVAIAPFGGSGPSVGDLASTSSAAAGATLALVAMAMVIVGALGVLSTRAMSLES